MSDDQKPPKEESEGVVIPFPVDRAKAKQKAKKLAGKRYDKKATLFLSILALLVGSAVVNEYAFRDARNVANDSGYVRDEDIEKRLAMELADPSKRGPASFGREPSAEDELRSVDLHSRYQLVHHENGKVIGIQLMPGTSVTAEPIYIKNRQAFLERYRKIIYPGFDAVEPVPNLDEQGLSSEVYLLKRGPASVGKAHFNLDRSGAFHKLKVEVLEN